MFHDEAMHERHRAWREMKTGKKAGIVAGWMVIVAAVIGAVVLAVMLLWNRVMSGVLGLPALNYWEALGLFVLLKLLISRPGSFYGKMRMRRAMRERMARRPEGGEGSAD